MMRWMDDKNKYRCLSECVLKKIYVSLYNRKYIRKNKSKLSMLMQVDASWNSGFAVYESSPTEIVRRGVPLLSYCEALRSA